MPLRELAGPVEPSSLVGVEDEYLIFYSSRDDTGKMWCPDCRDVEELVQQTFRQADARSGLIVFVGHKPEWKTPSNAFRAEPWKVTTIPTIIRVRDGARLVDGEIAADGLASFLRE